MEKMVETRLVSISKLRKGLMRLRSVDVDSFPRTSIGELSFREKQYKASSQEDGGSSMLSERRAGDSRQKLVLG